MRAYPSASLRALFFATFGHAPLRLMPVDFLLAKVGVNKLLKL
jgi:hypothetical protein